MAGTIVFQGWEPIKGTPAAVKICMDSVKIAAKELNHDYELIDQDFFAPSYDFMVGKDWSHLSRASFCRNWYSKKYFQKGYDSVIWVDSDVPVRSPSALVVPDTLHVTLEPQYYLDLNDHLFSRRQADLITNSVLKYSSISQVSIFLNAQIEKAMNIHKEEFISKTAMGTDLYTALGTYLGCDYFKDIVFATKDMRRLLVEDIQTLFVKYKMFTGRDLLAMNLCGSLLGESEFERDEFERAADNFLSH